MSVGIVRPEPDKIRKIITMAEQGDADAQYELGGLYENYLYHWEEFDIISTNYVKAAIWYRKAAEQGHLNAQYNLGKLYHQDFTKPIQSIFNKDNGISQDFVEAMKWYRMAAERGYKYAQHDLGRMYQNGEGVPKNYVEAMKWYLMAAEQGYDLAQNALGLMYYFGKGVTKDYVDAAEWFRKAAEQGHAAAEYNLAMMYNNGEGVPVDYAEAMKLCQKAADVGDGYTSAVEWLKKEAVKGNAEAQYWFGKYSYSHGGWSDHMTTDYSSALEWYHKAAEQGHGDAQYALGKMYYSGHGVEEDKEEAAKWYRKAARQGHADAQNNLGLMYKNGQGVSKDDVEAVLWFSESADQGNQSAQDNLDCMYEEGRGLPKDDAEAEVWWRKAAEQGNMIAQDKLGWMYAFGSAGVKRNDAEAVKWLRMAADQGNANAQYHFAFLYELGRGVRKDDEEAIKWYRKAAEQGDEVAQNHLGRGYRYGIGVEQDDKEAVKWFRRAAEQGQHDAQHNLGVMYDKGEGVKQSDTEAVKWYCKSAEQGYEIAQYHLGEMYYYGRGVPQNIAEAVKWFHSAAEQGNAQAIEHLAKMKAERNNIAVDGNSHSDQIDDPTASDSENNQKRMTSARSSSDFDECKTLLDACTPRLYKQNVFRISGIRIDATPREIKRRFDDLKTAVEMGDLKDELRHAFALNPVPNIDQIREAAQRIQDPEKRIIDEFFWFWPLDWDNSDNDFALEALDNGNSEKALTIWSDSLSDTNMTICTIAKHNLAVLYHLKAIDAEFAALEHDLSIEEQNFISKDWHTCFEWWEDLVDDEDLWGLVNHRIRAIDDPRLPTGFSRRLRATLPEAMDKINAMFAVNFTEKGKLLQATNHITYMKETHQGKDNVPKILSVVVKPLKARVDNAVERATNMANNAPDQAANAAFELLQAISAPIKVIQILLPAEDHERIDLCDSVAEVCLKCQSVYARENQDWTTSFKILDAALKFAASKETIDRLLTAVNSHYLDMIYEFCKTISDKIKENPYSADQESHRIMNMAPKYLSKLSSAKVPDEILSLGKDQFALLLDHCAVVFGNKTEKWKTCIKILEEAQKYASSQEVKSRIEKNLSTVKKNESIGEPISSAPSLSSFYGIGFNLYGSTDVDHETGSYLSTYYFTIIGIPVFPICRYRVIPIENGYRFLGKAPLRTFDKAHLSTSLVLLAIFTFYIVSQNNSQTNHQSGHPSSNSRVSSSASSNDNIRDSSPVPSYKDRNNRSTLAREIENGKSRAKHMEEQITYMDNQLDNYKRRANSYQDSDMINEYNDLVPTFNALVRERNKLFKEYNNLINEVNANVQRYNRGY